MIFLDLVILISFLIINYANSSSCPFKSCFCYSSIKFRTVANCSSLGEVFNFSSFKSDNSRIGALYLNDNKISFLFPGIFSSFSGLKLLDVSSNELQTVDVNVFKGLENSLETLNLSNNPLTSLVKKSFGKLKKLKFIQISTNSLICDCNLRGFIKLINEKQIELSSDSKCALPKKFRNMQIRSISLKNLTCDVEGKFNFINKTSLTIQPASSKLVVEGDSFEITCTSEIFSLKQNIDWFLNERLLDEKSSKSITILTIITNEQKSTVKISKTEPAHQGSWTCRLETDDYFTEKSVYITIWLQNRTCKSETVFIEKGLFSWKETAAGQTDHVLCPYWRNDTVRESAHRLCKLNGKWSDANVDQCPYSSEFVQILMEIDKNFPLDDGALIELANLTKNRSYIANADAQALNVILNIIDNRLHLIKAENVPSIVKIVNSLMDADRQVFIDGDRKLRLSERMLKILKKLPGSKSGFSLTFSNMALCEIFVTSTNFAGLFAGFFEAPTKQFLCVLSSKIESNEFPAPEAAIEMPPSLFSSDSDKVSNISLRFLWFRTPLFFPDANATFAQPANQNVLGAYLGDSLFLYNSINISAYPLRIRYRMQSGLGYHVGRWFQTGKVWENAECSENLAQDTISIYDCPLSFGFFTLLNEKSVDPFIPDPIILPPWMIVSSGFLIICLLVSVAFYCSAKNIGISVKFRHCLINFWISTSLLTLLLALGINQIHFKYVCLCISVGFHFLLLLNWFWMLLLSRTIHRKLTKIVNPPIKSEEDNEEPKDKVRRSKLIGMYSFAIGLSIMPCAFTLALSRTSEYVGDKSMCFLIPGMPMIGALLAPCGSLAVVSIFLILRSSCLLSAVRRKHLVTDDAQSISNEDLQTLTAQETENPADAVSLASSCVDDHLSIGRHLISIAIKLLLTTFSTALVCLYVWKEPANFFYDHGILYYDLIVGCLYSTTTTLLGGFVLWFYVLRRPECSEMCFKTKETKQKTGRDSRKSKQAELRNGHVMHRNCSTKADSPAENTCLLDSTHSPRKVNTGVVTKFDTDCSESHLSVTTGGGSVVNANSKYYRYQRAVARKFYDKRRSVRGDSQSLSEHINDSCSLKLPNMSTSLTDDNCSVPKETATSVGHQKHAKDLSSDEKNFKSIKSARSPANGLISHENHKLVKKSRKEINVKNNETSV